MSILDNYQFNDQNHMSFVKYIRMLDKIRQTQLTSINKLFQKYI